MLNQSSKKAQGFTLIELLVVMALAGFLLTVGVPTFNSVLADQRSTASVNELVQALVQARSEAIKRGQYVTICKSTNQITCNTASDWNEGWVVFANDSSANIAGLDVGDVLISTHQGIPDTMVIDDRGSVSNFISFRPTGTAGTTTSNSIGTLVFCDVNDNTEPRGIIVTPGGRIRVTRDMDHTDINVLACS